MRRGCGGSAARGTATHLVCDHGDKNLQSTKHKHEISTAGSVSQVRVAASHLSAG